MIATETGQDSCLAALYFKESVAALQVCETEQIVLPATEKAENLGYGLAYNVRYYYCFYFIRVRHSQLHHPALLNIQDVAFVL